MDDEKVRVTFSQQYLTHYSVLRVCTPMHVQKQGCYREVGGVHWQEEFITVASSVIFQHSFSLAGRLIFHLLHSSQITKSCKFVMAQSFCQNVRNHVIGCVLCRRSNVKHSAIMSLVVCYADAVMQNTPFGSRRIFTTRSACVQSMQQQSCLRDIRDLTQMQPLNNK